MENQTAAVERERPWRDEDDDLPADGQPPEVAAVEAADPWRIPPDEGDAEPEGIGDEPIEVEPERQIPEPEASRLSLSISGLPAPQRAEVRRRAVEAALLGHRNAAAIHYTQDWHRRWEGIARGLIAARGLYPRNADCSSFATWCLWNGLHVRYGMRDTVNGQAWRSGYTGTMLANGKPVLRQQNWLLGDLFLYGVVTPMRRQHVAIYVGDGWVISHGSEPGPFKLRWDYRRDVIGVRRYI
jgi:hypothetical protein